MVWHSKAHIGFGAWSWRRQYSCCRRWIREDAISHIQSANLLSSRNRAILLFCTEAPSTIEREFYADSIQLMSDHAFVSSHAFEIPWSNSANVVHHTPLAELQA